MACASSGKSSCAVGRGVLLVDFLGDALSELLDELALEEDFTDVSADECLFLPLPFCFLFFGPLFFFFCTFEGVASGLVAAGRFGVFAFLILPPAAFVGGGAGATAGTLPVLEALERVVGAMLLSCCLDRDTKSIRHGNSRVAEIMYTMSRDAVLCFVYCCTETSPETG